MTQIPQKNTQPAAPGQPHAPLPAPKGKGRRFLRILGKSLLALLLICGLSVAALCLYLRSPESGPALARATASLLHSLDCGVELEAASLEFHWPASLSIRELRLRDAQGEWLHIARARVALVPGSLWPSALLRWRVQVQEALIQGGSFSRLPHLPSPPDQEEKASPPAPLRLLPPWLALQADAIAIENLGLGAPLWPLHLLTAPAAADPDSAAPLPASGPVVSVRLRAHGLLESTQGQLIASTEALPLHEAPAPSDSSISGLEAAGSAPPAKAPQGMVRMALEAHWADQSLKLHADIHDTAIFSPLLQPLLPHISAVQHFAAGQKASPPGPAQESDAASGPQGLQVLLDLQAHIPMIPPLPDAPLQAQWTVGLGLGDLPATGQAPALKGAVRFDGKLWRWQDVALNLPPDKALLRLDSQGTFDLQQGPEGQLFVSLRDVALFSHMGLLPPAYSGAITSTLRLHKDSRLQWELESPRLQLPGGSLDKLHVRFNAEIPGTPPVQPHSQTNSADTKSGTPPGTQADTKSGTQPDSPAPPASSGTAPPPAWHLPSRLQGTLALNVPSCMGLGPASLTTAWGVDNIPWAAPESAAPLALRVSDLKAQLKGMRLNARLESRGQELRDAALDLSITDTTALARLANIPLKGGALSLKGSLSTPPAAKAEAAKIPKDPELFIPLADNALFTARLNLGAGSFGTLRWLSGEGQLQADSRSAALTMNLKGQLACRLKASYNYAQRQLHIDSFDLGESAKKLGARLQAPTDIRFVQGKAGEAGGIVISPLSLALQPSGALRLRGRLQAENLDLDATLEDIPLSLARLFMDYPLQGKLSASATLRGSPSSPTGHMQLRLSDLPLAARAGAPQAALLVKGSLARAGQQHSLQLQARLEGLDSLKDFQAHATLPLRFTPTPALLMDAPLKATVDWQGPVAPLWKLVPLPGRKLSGQAALKAQASGSLRKLQAEGHVTLGQGNFVDSIDGLVLRDITLEARYILHGASRLRLSAGDGRGGSLTLDGTLGSGPQASLQQNFLNVQGSVHKLRPLRRDDLSLQLSGTLAAKGPLDAPLVTGTIRIDQGLVQLLNGFGGGSVKSLKVEEKKPRAPAQLRHAASSASSASPPSSASPASSALPLQAKAEGPRCDIQLSAPGRLYIRGKGLDSEWKAALHISGPLDDPRILGQVSPLRGQLDLLGHQFTIASGEISFNGSQPINPALDLTLQYKSADITALIGFTGTAKAPHMKLSSQPVLPTDEIIAQILFGKSIHSLSRFEALQAANTARQLVDFGPSALDLLATTRDLLGLEVLRMGKAAGSRQSRAPRDASVQGSTTDSGDQAPTIEAGKYILDNVYVGLDQGTDAAAGTTVRVEIELLPNLSLEGKSSNESTGIGINWKKDY